MHRTDFLLCFDFRRYINLPIPSTKAATRHWIRFAKGNGSACVVTPPSIETVSRWSLSFLTSMNLSVSSKILLQSPTSPVIKPSKPCAIAHLIQQSSSTDHTWQALPERCTSPRRSPPLFWYMVSLFIAKEQCGMVRKLSLA